MVQCWLSTVTKQYNELFALWVFFYLLKPVATKNKKKIFLMIKNSNSL
jgi:hypothetical protein